MSNTTNATLVAAGARKIDRAGLALLPEPKSMGPRHAPVSHARLVSTLTTLLEEAHLHVRHEEFCVFGEGAPRIFGVMDIQSSNGMASWSRPGTSFALGLRGSTDESLSISIGIGQRVFVCTNLVMHSDFIALTRKSTVGLNLESELREAIERYKMQTMSLVERLDRAKTITLPQAQAKALMHDQFVAKTLPLHKLPKVAAWYFSPPAEATDVSEHPQTLYSLVQAFTRECRSLKGARLFNATARIGKLLTAV